MGYIILKSKPKYINCFLDEDPRKPKIGSLIKISKNFDYENICVFSPYKEFTKYLNQESIFGVFLGTNKDYNTKHTLSIDFVRIPYFFLIDNEIYYMFISIKNDDGEPIYNFELVSE